VCILLAGGVIIYILLKFITSGSGYEKSGLPLNKDNKHRWQSSNRLVLKSRSSWLQNLSMKTDFHSVQNVTRSTFCDHFLLKCVQSPSSVAFDCLYFKGK
jgi:hypothetical protein